MFSSLSNLNNIKANYDIMPLIRASFIKCLLIGV